MDLLTTNDVAALLNLPISTLRGWRHAGTGPASLKLGRRKVMYRRVDVEGWVEQQLRNEQKRLVGIAPTAA